MTDNHDSSIPENKPVRTRITPPTFVNRIPPSEALPLHPMMLPNSDRLVIVDVFLFIGFLLLCEVLISSLIIFLMGFGEVENPIENPVVMRSILFPTLGGRLYICLIGITAILKLRNQPFASVGLTMNKSWWNIIFGIAVVPVIYAIFLPIMIIIFFTTDIKLDENAKRLQELFPMMHPIKYVPIMLLVGLWEELVFRGFFMTRIRKATNSWILAIIFSTMLFIVGHISHQTIIAMLPIGILSIILSLLTIWRKSIIPAIIGHALFNLTQIASMYIFFGDQWKEANFKTVESTPAFITQLFSFFW